MSEYSAWFECINGCETRFSLSEIVYRCPSCGDLLDVVHDIDALRRRSPAAWMQPLRRALPAQRLPVRLGRVGQEGVGGALPRRRERRLHLRGRHEPAVGGPLRQDDRRRGPVGEAVRQLPHRIVQGPRHDGPGLGRQADDRRRPADRRHRLRLHRRHLRRAGQLLRRRRHSRRRAAAAPQGVAGAARAAAGQRRAGAEPGHRLRRLHGAGAGDHQGADRLPRQLDEQPAHRGPEDGRHRARAAVRLGGAGLGRDPRRQPRQRQRPRQGLPDDARSRPDPEAAAHRRGAGGERQSAVPLAT